MAASFQQDIDRLRHAAIPPQGLFIGGRDVILDAGRDLNIIAAQNSGESSFSSESGGGVGVKAVVGSGGMSYGINVAAQAAGAGSNADYTTTEHLSKMLGATQVMERQQSRASGNAMQHGDMGLREQLRSARLLDANEITRWFSRETGRQLVLVPGRPPIYMQRLERVT